MADLLEKMDNNPSLKARNAHLNPNSQRPVAKLEHCDAIAQVPATSVSQTHAGKSRVCITNYTCRPLDCDNVCAKFHVDALRYLNLIPDDSPAHIVLEMRQEKVAHRAQEQVVIEVSPITDYES